MLDGSLISAKQVASITPLLIVLISGVCIAQVATPGDFLVGQKSGTFDTWGLATGDFNRDGKLDIATVSFNENVLNVFLGNGDGTFTGAFSYTFSGSPNSPISIVPADVNEDGKLDLVVVNYNSLNVSSGGTVSIFFGNGDGTFSHSADYVVKNHPTAVLAADFNGDGAIDLAVPVNDLGTVAIFLNNKDGTFQPPISYGSSNGPYSIVAGDFNKDGHPDLAVTNYCNMSLKGAGPPQCNSSNTFYGSVSVLLGNGDGTFQTAKSYTAGVAPYGIAVGALRNSGNLDILVTDRNDGSLLVLLGNGDGTFQSPATYPADAGYFLTVEDFNGDGNLDVVGSGVSVVEFLGNGDGTLQQAMDYYRSTPGSPYFYQTSGDFNGDGHPDVAVGFGTVFSAFLNAAGTSRKPTTTTVQAVDDGCGDVTITAIVSASGTTVTGTLTLQFDGQYDRAVQFGNLDSSGRASVKLVSVPVGIHTIKVVYSGDSLTQASSGSSSINVRQQASTTTLSSGPNPSFPAQQVNLTAFVSSSGLSSLCDSGTVTFLSGATTLGTLPLGAGSATLPYAFLTSGVFSVTASYSGTTYIAPSVSTVLTQVVNPGVVVNPAVLTFPATTVGQTSPPESVTLTNNGSAALTIVRITPSDGFAETNNCGTTVAAGKSCTIAVTFTPTFSGPRSGILEIIDTTFDSPQTVALNAIGQDFSVTPSSQTTATVPAGTAANYSISIAPSGGFAQTVVLTCSGAPPQASCLVSPGTIAITGSSSATATVTVNTTARSSARLMPPTLGSSPANRTGFIGTLVFSFGLAMMCRIRRPLGKFRLMRCRLALLLVFALGCLSACGGNGSGGGGSTNGTPAGTYKLIVSASFTSSSGTVTRSTKLTLIVQ